MKQFIAAITIVIGTLPLRSQTRPSFEVASIKAGDAKDIRSGVHIQPGGLFRTENATLRTLISFAYDLRNYEISGGPPWMDSEIFTIEAKAPAPIPTRRDYETQIKIMIQSLLADRFRLTTHSETRQESVYDLVIARGGHKLRLADANATDSTLTVRSGHLIANHIPLSQLVHSLSLQFGRAVIDKTGMSGRYDFDLSYMPEARDGIFGQLQPTAVGDVDPNSVSIFTAITDQLGLQLESSKEAVALLVIDHAEKPDAN